MNDFSRTVAVSRRRRQRRRRAVTILGLLLIVGLLVVLAAQVSRVFAMTPDFMPEGTGVGVSSGFMPTDEDGHIPDDESVSVFDEHAPAVTRIDRDLLDALRRAASDAQASGVEFHLNSGWRSPAYQEWLLQDAIDDYGSKEEAARWVLTPETSSHVSGKAVDIGPLTATDWLAQHGADYGLCQTYANELWHYELRPDAVSEGCPQTYADAAHDPRLQG